jgi:hypothetical protein
VALGTAGKVAASATAAFTLSHLLQQLSGQALWVPSQLRVAVEVFTTLLGTAIYMRLQGRPRTVAGKKRSASLAIAWVMGAVLLFVGYLWLRSTCVVSWDPADWKVGKDDADIAALPDFVDSSGGQVYVPLRFPADLQSYVEQVDRDAIPGIGGLQEILMKEPDYLFDCLRGEGRMHLWATSVLFLVLHLAIVACVAVSAALAGARLKADPA